MICVIFTICVHGYKIENVLLDIELLSNILMNWFKEIFLQASLEKFQFILFSKTESENSSLIPQASVKLLGIHIDHALTLNQHISTTCEKAGHQLNVLGRLSNILNEREKYILFECFITSHLNYCPIVWHFCKLSEIKKIENIQKRFYAIL